MISTLLLLNTNIEKYDHVNYPSKCFDSHTASTAAGNHHVPVISNGFNYGYASGMAPGAR